MNDIYEKYRKGKFYAWHTNRNMTTDCCYTAYGSKITAAFVQAYGENKKDALDYMSKHLLYAESAHFRPVMKGGHRHNACMNAVSRLLTNSKAKRRKMRKHRNTTKQLAKCPKGIYYSFRHHLYDNTEDATKAIWDSISSYGKSCVKRVKKAAEVNTAPVTKLSDRQSKAIKDAYKKFLEEE